MHLDPHARQRIERLTQLQGIEERLLAFRDAINGASADELALVVTGGRGQERRFHLEAKYWGGGDFLPAAERVRIHDEALRAADRQPPEGGSHAG